MAKFLERAKGGDGNGKPAPVPSTCALMSKYAALTEFLVLSEWEDGSGRETGTLLLCVDAGCVKAWLNDRDGGRSAWLSSGSLTGLLDALESGLRDGDLEWRVAKRPQGKSARKST